MLRAAGDPTRLRLLLLLRQAELTVSELIEIVGQSQPRVSRHLKLLGEAGLVERFKEGSWVFCRAADRGTGAELSRVIAELADDAKSEIVERLAGVHQSINRSPWVPASYAEIVTKGLQANLRGIETIISKADRILEEYRRMPRIEDHVAA